MNFRHLGTVVGLSIAATSAWGFGNPGDFVLPTGFVEYGDTQSYALQVACDAAGLSNSKCPFFVGSTPGDIKDLIVVATSPSGSGLTTNPLGMDNPYITPNGSIAKPASPYFTTDTTTYNGTSGTVNGNLDNTWDASVGALSTFLSDVTNSNGLVFFFNNNQEKSQGTAAENLAAFAEAWVTGPNGTTVVSPYFYFTNQCANANAGTLLGGPYQPEPGGGCFGGNVNLFEGPQVVTAPSGAASGSPTDYVLSGGNICLNGTTKAAEPCGSTTGEIVVDNNLGANQAAYALVVPELNTYLLGLIAGGGNLSGYTLHVSVRLGCDPGIWPDSTSAPCVSKDLDNGYEQIFLGRLAPVGTPPTNIPEPATLALIGMALLMVGAASRKRRVGR